MLPTTMHHHLILHSLLLLTLFSFTYTAKCPTVKCADPPLTDNTCLVVTKSEGVESTKYTHCSDSSMACPPRAGQETEVKCKSKELIPKINLIDSQYCFKDSDCSSGKCYDNACIGFNLGSACTKTSDCGIGLFCYLIEHICEKQIPMKNDAIYDKRTCVETTDCTNEKACIKGQCTAYLSKKIGEEVPPGLHLLCETGIAKVVNGKNVCVKTTLKQNKLECQPNKNTCLYDVDFGGEKPIEQEEKCACSDGSEDERYCPLDSKNEMMVEYLSTMQTYLQEEVYDYHSALRFVSTNPNTRRMFLEIGNFPKYYKADDCAIELGLSGSVIGIGYWYSIAWIGLLGIFLL